MLTEIARDNLGFLAIILACVLERWMPLVSWYHPNTLLKALFSSLLKRVYRPKEATGYQRLSGALAFILPLIVICTLAYGLFAFAFHPEWLGGALLYLMLDSQTSERKTTRVARLLKQQQKSTARELVATLLARDSNKLSEAGIIKGAIESMTLRLGRHYFAVLFWFLLTGPVFTLAYRLMSLMHEAWRADLKPSSPFLSPLQKALWLFEWLPLRLLAITLLLGNKTKQSLHYLKHYARHYYQTNSGWLLSVISASLGAQIGGPAYYKGERFEKMRIGSQRLPVPEDIIMTKLRLDQAKSLWFSMILLIKLASVLVSLS